MEKIDERIAKDLLKIRAVFFTHSRSPLRLFRPGNAVSSLPL